MSLRRPGAVGLFVMVLAAVPACASSETAAEGGPTAGQRYTAPAGAPVLCDRLADSTYFLGIPHAVGLLVSGVQVVEARTQLAAARNELRTTVAALPEGENRRLVAAAEDVVAALRAVLREPLTEDARADLIDGMDVLVTRLAPACAPS
ncbi:hypothetical protein [Blastococcus sp. SYSU DS0619]